MGFFKGELSTDHLPHFQGEGAPSVWLTIHTGWSVASSASLSRVLYTERQAKQFCVGIVQRKGDATVWTSLEMQASAAAWSRRYPVQGSHPVPHLPMYGYTPQIGLVPHQSPMHEVAALVGQEYAI